MARVIKNRFKITKKELAESYFVSGDYQMALALYSEIYSDNKDDKEALVGVLLCDMAYEREGEAQAMYDYYRIIKGEGLETPEDFVIEIIKNLDNGLEAINSLLINNMSMRPHFIEGIMYSDFKNIVVEKGNFKTAFEDLMFSTRVVISEKDQFIEFVEDLIDNGYSDIAISYIENMSKIFVGDERMKELLERLENKTVYDDKNKHR